MTTLWVRSGGAWHSRNGQPSLRYLGAWVPMLAMYVMRWTLVSEDPLTYDKTWVRIFDYTQPTQNVYTPTLGWSGEEATNGPYTADVGWGALYGYPVEVIVEQWNGASWSQVYSGVHLESEGGVSVGAFTDGDEIRAHVRYTSHDDPTIKGPQTTLGPEVFTW